MLVAEFGPSLQFRQIMEAMKDVVMFTQMKLEEKGIQFSSIGGSSRSLVHVFIPASICTSYHWTGPPSLCSLNLYDLVDMMKDSRKKYQNIIGLIQNRATSQFTLKFYSEVTHQQTLPNQTISYTPLTLSKCVLSTLPEKKYDNICVLPSNELKRICIIMAILGHSVIHIGLQNNILKLCVLDRRSKGTETIERSQKDKNCDLVIIEHKDTISQYFHLRFLNFFTRASTLSDTTTWGFSKNYCFIEYKLSDQGAITYFLKPTDADISVPLKAVPMDVG